MGVGNSKGGVKYVSLKKGKIAIWDKAKQAEYLYDYVEGIITGHSFEEKEIEGKKREFLKINITDGDETFIVQMGVTSGYFRAFVNGLKSGDHKIKIRLTPTYSDDGANKNSSMFVSPAGDMQKSFPWYSTRKDPKDVPAAIPVEVNGETVLNRGPQIKYWKEWLNSLTWTSSFEASAVQYNDIKNEAAHVDAPAKETNTNDDFILEDDDMPF